GGEQARDLPVPGGDETHAVGTVEQVADLGAESDRGMCGLGGAGDVPHADRAASCSGGEQAAVRREADRGDRFTVLEARHLSPGRRVPDARGAVLARGGDPSAVVRERDAEHVAVAGESSARDARLGVPQPRAAIVPRGRDRAPIGAERDVDYPAVMSELNWLFRTSVESPQAGEGGGAERREARP